MVHGSGFRVGYFALFIFFEIVDESTNSSTCSSGLLVNIFEFVGRYVLFIQSDIEFSIVQSSSLSNLEPLNREPEQ